MGGTLLSPPKSLFIGGQQACEPIKLQPLCDFEFFGVPKWNVYIIYIYDSAGPVPKKDSYFLHLKCKKCFWQLSKKCQFIGTGPKKLFIWSE